MSETTVLKNDRKNVLQESMKKAASAAAEYFVEMMKATNTIIGDIRLEEIEQFRKDGEDFWRVTISFVADNDKGPLDSLYGSSREKRTHKIITVSDDDFVGISIKDRF